MSDETDQAYEEADAHLEQMIAFFEIPTNQRFSFKIEPEPGRLLLAKTVGGTLIQLGKLIAAIGDDMQPPIKMKVAVAGIKMDDAGAIQFDLVSATVKEQPKNEAESQARTSAQKVSDSSA